MRSTPRILALCLVTALQVRGLAQEEPPAKAEPPKPQELPKGRIFYVRQTVGSDVNDGLVPDRAWASISKLSDVLQAGDTAYVGPGLYRDEILVGADGTFANPITLVADNAGEYTGDPPGIVMIAGSDPFDATKFQPTDSPGMYKADGGEHPVGGVVEMDGPQFRYMRASAMKEHIVDKLTEIQVVAKVPQTYYYDETAKVVYMHTSDGKHPKTHEIELMRRSDGIAISGKKYITVVGFTVRHTADSGIRFWEGATEGIAVGNTAWGCRQGVRVYGATHILVEGNTLFRNENCGVYFAKVSTDGHVVGNIFYENVKGTRWSSESANGLAADNVAFDNKEAGVSVENADNTRVIGNRLVGNNRAQILTMGTRPIAEGNCLDVGSGTGVLAEYLYVKYNDLAAYQKGAVRDHGGKQGKCGTLPEKLDVHKLHQASLAYTDNARKILAAKQDTKDKTASK